MTGLLRHKTWFVWLALFIAVAAFLPYLGTLQADFVWDDDLLVIDHPYYRDASLFWALFTRNLIFSPNYWRPVGLLTFFADFQLYGFHPWGYHLSNVLIHALVSALAYLLLRRLLRGIPDWVPFGLAVVFAWHPIHVETVCFIAGRFDLLCTLFYLLALRLALAAWEAETATRRVALSVGGGLAFLLALGSKEMAVTLPLALLACWAWLVKRQPGNKLFDRAYLAHGWPVALALGIALLGYLGLRTWGMGYLYLSQPEAGPGVGNWLQHLLLIGRSVLRYVRLLVFPWGGLSPVHHIEQPVPVTDLLAWLGLALTGSGLLTLGWMIYRRISVAWLWLAFAVTLLPAVNILPLELAGSAFISERFAYIPSFFFLAAAGATIASLARHIPAGSVRRYVAATLAGVFAAACLFSTLITIPHWRNDVALWTWASQRTPQSDLPWVNLGVQAGNRGEAELALDYANRALAIDSDKTTAHDTAGLALFLLGDYAGAETAFRTALEPDPSNAHVLSNLAGAVREQGRVEEASHILVDRALPLDPTMWTAHLGLGLCHLATGRPDLAVEPFRRAVYYQPQTSETWERLIEALVASGQGEEAIEVMEQAPFASPGAWFLLGNNLLEGGQPDRALKAYDRALVGADPVNVHLQRSVAFVQVRDWDQAEAALNSALSLAPDDGRVHNNLGMVLRDRGEPELALRAFDTAWQLLPDSATVAANLAQCFRDLGRESEAAEWQARADGMETP